MVKDCLETAMAVPTGAAAACAVQSNMATSAATVYCAFTANNFGCYLSCLPLRCASIFHRNKRRPLAPDWLLLFRTSLHLQYLLLLPKHFT